MRPSLFKTTNMWQQSTKYINASVNFSNVHPLPGSTPGISILQMPHSGDNVAVQITKSIEGKARHIEVLDLSIILITYLYVSLPSHSD